MEKEKRETLQKMYDDMLLSKESFVRHMFDSEIAQQMASPLKTFLDYKGIVRKKDPNKEKLYE